MSRERIRPIHVALIVLEPRVFTIVCDYGSARDHAHVRGRSRLKLSFVDRLNTFKIDDNSGRPGGAMARLPRSLAVVRYRPASSQHNRAVHLAKLSTWSCPHDLRQA